MCDGRVRFCFQFALITAVLLGATFAMAQEKLPDAPTPQNNAQPPNVNLPPAGTPESPSGANPETPANTRPAQPPGPEQTNPQPPPSGSQQVKTVPPGSVPPGENAREQLFTLQKNVSFVTVPVTVKDSDGRLVDGLLQKDFSIYEDNLKQQLRLFTSDPFPLSTALVLDLGMSELTWKKVHQTFSALGGSFGPFDEVSVFTYGNTVSKRSDFGNVTRMGIALQRVRDERAQNAEPPVVGGPFGAGPSVNGKPLPGTQPQVQTAPHESHVLNDAILMAAQDLARRPRQNRKIIFVISDGQELGSRASYSEVLKVLLTDEIAVYAIGVDKAAMPVVNKIEKVRIPGLGYSDILPRYANATGGDVLDEFSREAIESAYQRITLEARNQYTLGYNTPQKPSSNYRDIEVRVDRPGLQVFAKHGYYPLPPQREGTLPATTEQAPAANQTPQ